MFKTKSRKIAIIVIAIICFVSILYGINKVHLNPFKATLNFNGIVASTKNDENFIAIDQQSTRLLFANENYKLNKIVDMQKSGSEFDKVSGLTIYNDTVYVFGYNLYNDGTYLSSEKIAKYDTDGNFIETIFIVDYPEEEYVTKGQISNICTKNGKLFVSFISENKVDVESLDLETNQLTKNLSVELPENPYSSHLIINSDIVVVQTTYGKFYACNSNEEVLGPFSATNIKSAVLDHCDNYYKKVFEQRNDFLAMNCNSTVNSNEELAYISFVDFANNTCYIFDGNSISNLTGLKYGGFIFITNLLFWISLCIVALTLVGVLIWCARKKMLLGKSTIVLVFVAILLTSVFYTYNSSKQLQNEYEQCISTQLKQIIYIVNNQYNSKDIANSNRVPEIFENEEFLDISYKIDDAIAQQCAAHGSEYSLYIKAFLLGTDEYLYVFSDTMNNLPKGYKFGYIENITEFAGLPQNAQLHSGIFSDILYNYDYFYDADGNIRGLILVGCSEANIEKIQTDNLINLTVSLIAIFTMIFVSRSALRTFKLDIKRFKSRSKDQVAEKAVDMSGIFTFVFGLTVAMDSVILIFVCQSLVGGYSLEKQAVLLSVPIALQKLGSWLGQIVYPKLRKIFGSRLLALIAGAVSVGSILLIAFSVYSSSFILFALGKLIYGFFILGIISKLGGTLPLMSSDTETTNLALNSTKNASIAATIISMLIGGYISELFSYTLIYILSAIFAAIVLVLSLAVFNNDKKANNELTKQPKEKGKSAFSFFVLKPILLFIILYEIPAMLVHGYSSYLFPLYVASCGLSTVLLTNLKVFSRTLTYLLGKPISKFTSSHDATKTICVAKLIVSVCLICFILSPNIYWAIAVLFIIDIMNRFCSSPSTMYVRNCAIENGFDPADSVANENTLASAIYIPESPIMSGFISLGYNLASVVVGAVCFVMFGAFTLINKKFKSKEQNSLDNA